MMTKAKKSVEALWKEFTADKTGPAREELSLQYLHLVKYLSDRIVQHLPSNIRANEREDLYVEGIIGLLDAMERFDLSRKVKFETYASKRIRGNMLDYLRKQDIVPKSIRDNASKIESAMSALWARLGRQPDDREIMKELQMTEETFYDTIEKVSGISVLSLDSPVLTAEGDKLCLEEIIGERGAYTAEYEREEAVRKTAEIIDKLEKEERMLLEMYYWDGLTLKETGKALGVSESRACQIHAKIVLKIRSGLRILDKER